MLLVQTRYRCSSILTVRFSALCALIAAMFAAVGLPHALQAAERSAVEIVKLAASPATIELFGPQAQHGLVISGVDAAGKTFDVSGEAKFSSSDETRFTVDATGQCRSVGDGEATLRVAVAGKTLEVPVTVSHAGPAKAPSFVNDVMPLLTRLGCNQGACHGKNEGRAGFKLSLRGYAPEWDIERITRESRGRRISHAAPKRSLLLLKATGQAPHGGGALTKPDSREYAMLLAWLKAGAPGPVKNVAKDKEQAKLPAEPQLVKLQLLPGDVTLQPGDVQRLIVQATYDNGQVRDVTWLTQLAANDASILSVDPAGSIRVLRQGETAVRAHFQGLVAIAVFTIPYGNPLPADRYVVSNAVDKHVTHKLAALGIPAAPLSSDEIFFRRVMLDTIGTLPTVEDVRTFIADKSTDKRARLIESLFERPEFVDYWAVQLGDLLQNRKERDHDVRGPKSVRAMHQWLRTQVARNRPWNELARDVLTATGGVNARPELGYYVVNVGEKQEAEKSEIVAAAAQAFLGTRIGCAQCHNHPLEKYTQDDYYHFAAFFSRVRIQRKDSKSGETVLTVGHKDKKQEMQPVGVVQPRTGVFLAPQPLDRSRPDILPGEDPRVKLAEWITSPQNEYFAGSMVNRLWRHFMAVGLVEPVDDLRASNPPSNPELWKTLNAEFVSHNYDLRHVMRLILNSRTYQASAETEAGNQTDTRFYSHYYARRLSAEVLLDAISQATLAPERFGGYPLGVRALQLPDPGLDSYFLTQFGRSERVTACACERRGEVTISQLLQLQNGDAVIKKIAAGESRLTKLLNPKDQTASSPATDPQATSAAIIEELFLATLSRMPSKTELETVTGLLAEPDADRSEVLRDTFWALLNSKEFAFNR